jgi:subtilase family serine protease
VNRPGNAHYGQYLTHEQFVADYAPTEAQVKSVVDYLRKSGFVNIEVAPNRLLVSAHGTAGTVKTAFNTSLVHFQYAGRAGFANASTAQVPRALGDVVGSVLGLQNVARARPMLRIGNVAKPQTLAAGTATGHYPKEFPGLYNATGVPTAAGVTVGIVTIGGVSQTLRDLKQFTSSNGYGTVTTQAVKTNGTGTSGSYSDDQDGQGEWDLDSQSIVGSAGGQVGKLVFYMADLNAAGNTGLTQAFNRVVSDNTAKVINVSLGWCETDANADGTLDAEEQIFTTAAAQGQTFSVSSGDEGVYECNNRGYPDGSNYTVSWPAASPHVLAIGGDAVHDVGRCVLERRCGTKASTATASCGRRAAASARSCRRRRGSRAATAACRTCRSTPRRAPARTSTTTASCSRSAAPASPRRSSPASGAAARGKRHRARLPGRQVLCAHSVESVAGALRRGVGQQRLSGVWLHGRHRLGLPDRLRQPERHEPQQADPVGRLLSVA